MSDILRGVTFTTGIPDAATLHNLVDSATILPAFISGKALAVPSSGDSFVFVTAGGALRRATLDKLIQGFPRGGAGGVFALRKLGNQAGMAAAGDDSRFPARLTAGSIRKANGTSPDTAAEPQDFRFPSFSMVGKTIIDWDESDVFTDTLSTNKTYTFSNVRDGRTIQFVVNLNAHTVTMPGAIGVVEVGTGTTIKHYILTKSAVGTTGLCIKI